MANASRNVLVVVQFRGRTAFPSRRGRFRHHRCRTHLSLMNLPAKLHTASLYGGVVLQVPVASDASKDAAFFESHFVRERLYLFCASVVVGKMADHDRSWLP